MKYLVTACAFLLTGCQHLNYQPPSGDDTATVTFTTNSISAQPMVCVPGKGFKATEYALTSSGSEALSDLRQALKKSPQVTTSVTAGTSTRIGVAFNRPGDNHNRDRCQVALLFTPSAGSEYNAHFVYENDQCGLSLEESSGGSADAVLTDWECP
jgi:hypothetical protein